MRWPTAMAAPLGDIISFVRLRGLYSCLSCTSSHLASHEIEEHKIPTLSVGKDLLEVIRWENELELFKRAWEFLEAKGSEVKIPQRYTFNYCKREPPYIGVNPFGS
jgi:hypothetical protein